MAQINDTTKFEAEHAKRRFAELDTEARQHLRTRIAAARRDLDEAERRLDAGDMPNTCGVLQTRATDIEMAIGRLAALRDAAEHFRELAKAFDATA